MMTMEEFCERYPHISCEDLRFLDKVLGGIPGLLQYVVDIHETEERIVNSIHHARNEISKLEKTKDDAD